MSRTTVGVQIVPRRIHNGPLRLSRVPAVGELILIPGTERVCRRVLQVVHIAVGEVAAEVQLSKRLTDEEVNHPERASDE